MIALETVLRDLFVHRFIDLRATLPRHATLSFAPIDSRSMAYLVVHHSAGPYAQTWDQVARYHIAADPARTPPKEPWAGIGYHFGIQAGRLYYLGDVDTKRAHVALRNHECLGVCIMGTYTTTAPRPEDLAVLHTLIYVLDLFYAHKKTVSDHRLLTPPGYTACPGDALHALIAGLGYRLKDALVAESNKRQVVQLNPNAALQKAILAAGPAGWQITSGEFGVSYGGVSYVCCRAEHIASGEVRIFYVPGGQWADVSYVTR